MKLSVLINLYGTKTLDETLKIMAEQGITTVEVGAGGYPGKAHCNPAELLADAAKLEEFKALALAGEDVDAVDAAYLEFEDMLNHIETQAGLATLIYYYDTTIEEHNNQYLNIYEKYGDLHNTYIDVCKELYNNSPIRDILFEEWTEDEIKSLLEYSPEIQELNQRNEELLVELNALNDPYFYDRAAEIYAEMVANNNRIASHLSERFAKVIVLPASLLEGTIVCPT